MQVISNDNLVFNGGIGKDNDLVLVELREVRSQAVEKVSLGLVNEFSDGLQTLLTHEQ
jgi:hypothetical protein